MPQRDALGRFLPAGKHRSHVTGLSGNMRERIGALLQAGPKGLQIGSGFRSVEHQRRLWKNALRKYGSAAKARKWVAPPGRSKHNTGQASDIWFNGVRLDKAPAEIKNWVHQNAPQYGLEFPLGNEPWHIEVAGARSGQIKPFTAQASAQPDPLAPPSPEQRAQQLFAQSDMRRDVPSQDTLTPADRGFEGPPVPTQEPPRPPVDITPPDDRMMLAQALQGSPASPVTPPPAIDASAAAQAAPGTQPIGGLTPQNVAGLVEALMGSGGQQQPIELPPLRRPQNQVTQMQGNQQRIFL